MSVVIISGSRSITDYELLVHAIKNSGFDITEIVEGECGKGVDQLAKKYGHENNLLLRPFPANWNDIHRPGALVKINRFGKPYDAAAGHVRNEEMSKYAATHEGKCIVLWDGISKGSASMIKLALAHNLPLYVSKVRVVEQPLWNNK